MKNVVAFALMLLFVFVLIGNEIMMIATIPGMRPLFIRMNNGQYLDGQGLSADNTDNHETDKACPRTSRTTNGMDKACPQSRRTSSGTDKACPRTTRTIIGRTRLVRGQDGTDKGCPWSRWDGQGLSGH
uniref:Uncharacterized protein n=1 Tax=Acrobeloides nanus TaxID=290746 RepID=A0A914CJU1_9BILA